MDSSALVKRYVSETGSAWMQQIVDPEMGNLLFVARITWVETRSAFARRQLEGSLTPVDVAELVELLRFDFNNQYSVIELDSTLVETAGQLVSQYPLKSYDAVQLASALQLQSIFAMTPSTQLIFLTADGRLLSVAQSIGLLTDNPNHHP